MYFGVSPRIFPKCVALNSANSSAITFTVTVLHHLQGDYLSTMLNTPPRIRFLFLQAVKYLNMT